MMKEIKPDADPDLYKKLEKEAEAAEERVSAVCY